MKKRAVAVVISDFVIGGVSSVAMSIYRNTPKDAVSYFFIKGKDFVNAYDEEIKANGDRIVTLPKRAMKKLSVFTLPEYDLQRVNDLYKILKENGPFDAIHIHDYCFSAVLAAKRAKIPNIIVQSHSGVSEFYGNEKKSKITMLFWKIRQHIYRKYTTYKCGDSVEACHAMFGEKAFLKEKPIVITPGLNLKKFDYGKYDRFESRKLLDISDDAIYLIHMGRLSKVKNQEFIIDIFDNLVKRGINSRLTFIGSGDLEAGLRKKVADLALTGKVVFLPADCESPKYLIGADFFLLPSFSEGFGLVLTEAQAMHLRCIASDVVSNETNAGLVTYLPLGDANVWADEILKQASVEIPELDESVLKKYDELNIANKVLSLYFGEENE